MNTVTLLVLESRKKTVKNHVNLGMPEYWSMIEFEIKLIFPVSKGNKSPHEKVMIKLETKNNI